jgi:hypothetical protein
MNYELTKMAVYATKETDQYVNNLLGTNASEVLDKKKKTKDSSVKTKKEEPWTQKQHNDAKRLAMVFSGMNKGHR